MNQSELKKNLILLLFTVCLGLLALETTCRIIGRNKSYNERTRHGGYHSPFITDDMGWTHTGPAFTTINYPRSEFDVKWKANNEGLKGDNLGENEEGKRLIVLGDSYIEGVGTDNNNTVPKLLESLIRTKNDSTFEVVNAGMSGSDAFFAYKLLTLKLLKYKPDIVLLNINGSDVGETVVRGGFERFLPQNKIVYRKAPWFEALYAHSFLCRFLVHDICHYDFNFVRQNNYHELYPQIDAKLETALDSFQLCCNAHSISFAVFFQPTFLDIENDTIGSLNPLVDYCSKKGIVSVNGLNYFKRAGVNQKTVKTYYWPIDGHFNTAGYNVLANGIYQFLCDSNVIGKKAVLRD